MRSSDFLVPIASKAFVFGVGLDPFKKPPIENQMMEQCRINNIQQ